MSEKTSQIIMIGELIIIVLPSTLLLAFFTFVPLTIARSSTYLYQSVLFVLVVFIPWSALISGISLMMSFIKHGAIELHYIKPYLWWFCALGAMISIAGVIITFNHPFLWSPTDYQSGAFSKLGDLKLLGIFVVASPLLIPYTHLLLERYLRKETQTS